MVRLFVNLTNEHPPTKENGFPMYSGRYDAKQLPLPPPYEMDQFSPMPVHYDMNPPFMKKDKYMSSGYPEYLHSTGPSPLEDTGKGILAEPCAEQTSSLPEHPMASRLLCSGRLRIQPDWRASIQEQSPR